MATGVTTTFFFLFFFFFATTVATTVVAAVGFFVVATTVGFFDFADFAFPAVFGTAFWPRPLGFSTRRSMRRGLVPLYTTDGTKAGVVQSE